MCNLLKVTTGSHPETNLYRVRLKAAVLLCGLVVLTTFSSTGLAGSARDYLNAPIDSWLTFYNVGYSTSVTPEDGMDVTSSIRANVLSQSLVVTRTMDYWGRTGGISVILPYRYLEASSDAFSASNQGLSDIGFLWQMNIFGGPALTKEQFRSFVPQTYASFHFFVAHHWGHIMRRTLSIPVRIAGRSFRPSTTATRLIRVGHGSKLISRPKYSRPITITA
jgi:hypothetical protein